MGGHHHEGRKGEGLSAASCRRSPPPSYYLNAILREPAAIEKTDEFGLLPFEQSPESGRVRKLEHFAQLLGADLLPSAGKHRQLDQLAPMSLWIGDQIIASLDRRPPFGQRVLNQSDTTKTENRKLRRLPRHR